MDPPHNKDQILAMTTTVNLNQSFIKKQSFCGQAASQSLLCGGWTELFS